jgi:hypothetical protein
MESNNNFCIYITKYKRKKCKCNTVANKKLCYKHAKYKKQEFFKLLQTIYDNNYNLENINIQIINDCFNYLYNIDANIEGKKILFIKIIDYLFSINDLINISLSNNLIVKKKFKTDLIINFYDLLLNTNNISQLINYNILIKLQNNIKKSISKNYEISNVTHEKDPFTLENIEDIPENLRFYFRDGKLYCFNIIQFEYYLRTNNKNPYTNNTIKQCVINKLNYIIKKKNLTIINNQEYIWDNINLAYTDVVYYMEKIGFYNNILWFTELNYIDILNCILHYTDLCTKDSLDNIYFEEIIDNLTDENFHYEFAKEIINLFKDGNNHFILCCNFVKSLGKVSKKFENNIPEWLDDNSINIYNINNNNFLSILLNNYMNSSNVIYTNIRNNPDVDDNDLQTTTLYYLVDFVNRTT